MFSSDIVMTEALAVQVGHEVPHEGRRQGLYHQATAAVLKIAFTALTMTLVGRQTKW